MNKLMPRKISILALIALLTMQAASALADDTDTAKTETVTYLGVTAKSVDPALASQLNLPEDTGLTLQTVDRKGPASADLQVNDVLQKLDDQILIDSHQLVTLIHLHKPGDSVTLTIIRQGKPTTVTIKLGKKERIVPAPGSVDRGPDLPGVHIPDDVFPRAPGEPQLQLAPNSQVAMAFSDDTYSAEVKTDTQGRRHITVKDQITNTVVQTGPVNTEEEWQKMPAKIREHLEIMHKALGLKKK